MSQQKSNSSVSFSSPEISTLKGEDLKAVEELCKIATKLTGVQLSVRHQSMIASRLQKRISELGLTTLKSYLEYFEKHQDGESPKLISLATTHHTFFFREFSHFEYLSEKALPALLPVIQARSDKTLYVWAAACSRGQEVYSLAMYLDFHLKKLDPSLKFKILGTDIDSESVQIAKNGVYLRSELKEAPLTLLGNHWAKGTGAIEAYVKAKNTLRDHCNFDTLNLLEIRKSSAKKINQKFDIIFCRNVFIYFNPTQIKQISEDLLQSLNETGYFFIGVSESLNGLGLSAFPEGPSVYAKKKRQDATPTTLVQTQKKSAPALVQTGPIRVLCVDDSPSIHALLKKILSPDQGFEIVGTALNGLEANEKVKALKPDVITLDIHMPEQNGIEYLEKNYRFGHPPVMMVTSVSREDAALAGKALKLGASDYVEKPALTNLLERGDEIRAKLKFLRSMGASSASSNQFDQPFLAEKKFQTPDNKLRIIVASFAQREKLKKFFSEFKGPQPATVILIEGAKNILPEFAKTLSSDTIKNIQFSENFQSQLKSGEIFLCDFSSCQAALLNQSKSIAAVSISVFGEISKTGASKLLEFSGAHLVVEDLGNGNASSHLKEVASEVVPYTTFAYSSSEFFYQSELKKSKVA